MLKEIEIEGFKSFGSPPLRVHLSKLNFLVGPNASGKTNFTTALRFLQNCVRHKADFAVNDLGGPDEVRTKVQRERKASKHLRITVRFDDTFNVPTTRNHDEGQTTISAFKYSLAVDLRKSKDIPVIVDETLFAKVERGKESAEYALQRDEEKVTLYDPTSSFEQSPQEITVPQQEKSRPALAVGFYSLPAVLVKQLIEGWTFFNISPRDARKPSRGVPEATLGMYGENLPVLLRDLQAENGEDRLRSIVANLRRVVPGFQNVEAVKTDYEGRWTFRIKEERIPGHITPTSASDGTIRLLATMVATSGSLDKTLIVIEEPENGVHPHLFEYLTKIFRETSEETQVIATTHNPMFLDHLNPEEVFLCGKTKGLSRIRRADDVKEIRSFQKHFSLGELWVQGTFDSLLE